MCQCILIPIKRLNDTSVDYIFYYKYMLSTFTYIARKKRRARQGARKVLVWYIYLCDHSDRCNFTLEEEVHLQRDLAIKNSVLSPLVVYGETSRQGLARRSRRWTDEACRFMYFESITGSCSEKEGEKTSLGYRLLFVKYSNVNSILFFLGKSSIFTLELWKSDFQPLTTKSDNKCHPTVKTGQIWPLGWFWRWFCIF